MASAEDIARLWAEQAPKGPRKAGNFWRDGVEAGHWGTCVARMVESPHGPVALIMNGHYGTGTAMFINLCHSKARKAWETTFRVHIPSIEAHAKNVQWFERRALECEAKIAKAKSVDWQAKADAIRAEANRYRKAFDLK